MSKELIFIGGSKGVGKTSLAKTISLELGFDYINTGERFRRYRPSFDELFCQELIELEGSVIIDTHYAAGSSKTPYDLHIGFGEKDQMHLESNSVYSGKIILITADPESILERRKKDGEERRCLEIPQIIKENEMNAWYSQIYAAHLNLPHKVFKNEGISLEEAIDKLSKELKK